MADLPSISNQQYDEYKNAIESAARLSMSERRERLDNLLYDLKYKFYSNRDTEYLIDYARKEY